MSVSPDSQYIEQRAAELYEKAPAQALALIDSAEQTGPLPTFALSCCALGCLLGRRVTNGSSWLFKLERRCCHTTL